jgi:hypothetical protein
MAGKSGELKQESYNLLSSQLEESDVYPFTVALVERNINVRTGSGRRADIAVMEDLVYGVVPQEDVEPPGLDFMERMARAAQTMRQREPGGLWAPEQYIQDIEPSVYFDTPEGEEELVEELTEEDIEWMGSPEEYEALEEVEALQDELEFLGISLSPDGQVSFYQSNLPGLYTEQIPMRPMPLEKAFKYYEQSLRGVDREQTRVNQLQDLLARLTTATGEVEFALDDLDAFSYSSESKSPEVQGIAYGLEEVKANIASGDWNVAGQSLNNLKALLEEYSGGQYGKYEQSLATLEALDRLMDIQELEPEKFQQISQGLGALPVAAYRRYAMAFEDVVFFPVDSSNVEEFGYDEENRILYVRFLAKGSSPSSLYQYEDVEPEVYDQFFEAPSKGRFIWSHLRGRYNYARLE